MSRALAAALAAAGLVLTAAPVAFAQAETPVDMAAQEKAWNEAVLAARASLPVFWAILLAAPGIRRVWWPLIQGTALVTLLEILLVVCFVEISAHKVAAQFYPPQGDTASWFLRFGEYMVVNVIPFAAPFLIAIGLHRELRWQMLRWGSAEAESAVLPEKPSGKPKSARLR